MVRSTAVCLLAIAIIGCDSASAPDDDGPVGPLEPSFSFETVGAESGSHRGRGMLLPVDSLGFAIVNPQTGTRTQFAVTPIVLADSSRPSAPQLFIGILADVRAGVYNIWSTSAARKFYADFTLQLEDASRRFSVTGGTLTITRVTAQGIAGHFVLESRMYFDWPRNPAPGTISQGVQTSLALTGEFVATKWGPFAY